MRERNGTGSRTTGIALVLAAVAWSCGNDDPGDPPGGAGGSAPGGQAGVAGSNRGGSAGSPAGGSGGAAAAGGDAGEAGNGAGEGGAGGRGGTSARGGTAGQGGDAAGAGTSGEAGEAGQAGDGMGGTGGSAGAGGGGSTPCAQGPSAECPCLKVAPDGDDDAAAASQGLSPFASVQTAIDFAAAHPDLARHVCVASGASCGATHAYAGPGGDHLEMRSGIGVFGRYESSGWTRCPTSLTRLEPSTALGVVFGPEIDAETRLDGFTVQMAAESETAAVTVAGANGAWLENVVIASSDDYGVVRAYGVDVFGGGDVVVTDSTIAAVGGASENVGVRSEGSLVTLEQSSVDARGIIDEVHGVWLLDSPASTIRGNQITVAGSLGGSSSDGASVVSGITVLDDVEGVSVAGNQVSASSFNAVSGIVVSGSGAVEVVGNSANAAGEGTVDAIRVDTSSAIIQANSAHASVAAPAARATGIFCGASACEITGNSASTGATSVQPGSYREARGIDCSSCRVVESNSVSVLSSVNCFRACAYSGVGLRLGGAPLVARNVVDAGCADAATGVVASGGRLENNRIRGRLCLFDEDNVVANVGLRAGAGVDVHSNTIDGGSYETNSGTCGTSAALQITASGGTFRNNILTVGPACPGYAVLETSAAADPLVFQNNDLVARGFVSRLYLDENVTELATAAAVNALGDAAVSGNFSADPLFVGAPSPFSAGNLHLAPGSPCIDAGTLAGAPLFDIDGDPRSAPDVGADEWGNLSDRCDGVTCSGNGVCRDSGSIAFCECYSGYQNPAGNSLACEDVNECAADNGGCDPLTTCMNTGGGRTCSECPDGYLGSGETGCFPDPCNGVTCSGRGNCEIVDAGATCACNQGYRHPPGDPLSCENVDECTEDTHACDPLTTCVDQEGGWSCTACPVGCAGTGETGCNCGLLCQPNPCQNGGTCTPRPGSTPSHECACPTGVNGTNCDLVFSQIAGGFMGACGLMSDGRVLCWGVPELDADPPVGTFASIAMGPNQLCALDSVGSVHCFGSDQNGVKNTPSGVFSSVAVSGSGACGVLADGSLLPWGTFTYLGPPPAGSFVGVDLGGVFACGLRADRTIACWGSTTATSYGQQSPPPGPFEELTTGTAASCARRADGTVACWGARSDGEPFSAPTGTFLAIDYQDDYGCGIRPDQTLSCWGTPPFGFATDPPIGTFAAVATGIYLPCALRTDHGVVCWGPFAGSVPIPTGRP